MGAKNIRSVPQEKRCVDATKLMNRGDNKMVSYFDDHSWGTVEAAELAGAEALDPPHTTATPRRHDAVAGDEGASAAPDNRCLGTDVCVRCDYWQGERQGGDDSEPKPLLGYAPRDAVRDLVLERPGVRRREMPHFALLRRNVIPLF